MGLTRASLLKRALVGGVAITFGKLPDQLAHLPAASTPEAFSVVNITTLRTAIPSAARLSNVKHAHVVEPSATPRLSGEITLLEPDSSPLIDLLARQQSGQLGTYTAQQVDWLEDELMPRYSDVLFDGEIGELTVSEPAAVRYFLPGDILRNEHSGDLLHVDSEVAPHTYRVHHIGATELSRALVDQKAELAAIAAAMPKYEPVRRSPSTQFGEPEPHRIYRDDDFVTRDAAWEADRAYLEATLRPRP